MEERFENWIESVRQKPEPIRRRYAIVCVAISMALVIGVWLLSVGESFRNISSDTSTTAEDARNLIPTPSSFSLDQMIEGNGNLGGATAPASPSGQEFFESQIQEKATPDFQEGVAPTSDEGAPTH